MFRPESHLFDEAQVNFDPALPDATTPKMPLDLIPRNAERAISSRCPEQFRTLLAAALNHGLVSKQTLKEKFGDVVCVALKSNRMPDPATHRSILSFLSELDPTNATGSKHPWRHAQCARPAAEPAPQG